MPIISQIIKTSKILYGDLSEINILPGVSVLKRTPFLDSSKANDLHIKDKAALLIPYSPNPKNGFDGGDSWEKRLDDGKKFAEDHEADWWNK